MKRILSLLTIVLIISIAAQCPGGVAPTPSPVPTATPEPTATPAPTPIPSCSVQAQAYIAGVEELIPRWDDANALANHTARIALSGPVGQLQQIRRDAAALNPPPCAQKIHPILLDYMDRVIEAYMDFMTTPCDECFRLRLSVAEDRLKVWTEEFGKLKAGVEPYN